MMTFDSKDVDRLVDDALFGVGAQRSAARQAIRAHAMERGVVLGSLSSLYRERARDPGRFHFTVPALNVRGMSYDFCRAIFRSARRHRCGAFIVEIARSEMEYTDQRPDDVVMAALAGAIREGYEGPLFLQGDHFKVLRGQDRGAEVRALEALIRESVEAGFFNIDVDASALVGPGKIGSGGEQAENAEVTAHLTRFIRRIEPTEVNVGGEIGEIGGRTSTVNDLRTFMHEYERRLGQHQGITKVAVQTGTSHGGIPNPDGSLKHVHVDFEALAELSRVARAEYRLAGVVQHGASTLSDDQFSKFPEVGCVEVHLSTEFQNIILDHRAFPKDLRREIEAYVEEHFSAQRQPGQTRAQLLYKNRKHAWGPFRKTLATLPNDLRAAIGTSLEERVGLLFQALGVRDTQGLVETHVLGHTRA